MKSSIFARITAWLILPVIIIASIIVVSAIRTSAPANPLSDSIVVSDLDEVGAGALGLPESILSSANDSKTDSNSKDESVHNADQSKSYTDSSKQYDNKNPSFPGTSKKRQYTGLNTTSDNSDIDDGNIADDKRSTSPDKTDIDYFTTSITDGETVPSRSYYFSITHTDPELKAKNIFVYVNGTKQAQFDGRVLLEEGKNKIRIDVTYTDKDSKAFSVFRDYTVYVKLNAITINTDLTDRTVDSSTLSFYAIASIDGEELPLTVICNGNMLVSQGNRYTAHLKESENTIVISSSRNGKSISKTYFVTYKSVKPVEIKTSLKNCTVNESDFSFSAYTTGGSPDAKLNVTFNGTPLAYSNDYNVVLKTGSNQFRLKAFDVINGESITSTQDYIVKYIPVADETTAPKIQYINITDGMSIKGCDYNLDILPVDYNGDRIYYSGIAVRLNGTTVSHQWDGKYTSYSLYFKNGTNRIDIRISDTAGRYTDYIYDINCFAVSDGEEIGTVTISVDANVLGLGTLAGPEQVALHQGESASSVVLRFLNEHGFLCEYSGDVDESFYLSRLRKNGVGANVSIPNELIDEINKHGLELTNQHDANSIGDLDYCQGAGWIYSINNSFPNYSLSNATLKDGYELRIRFTLAYGKDIGGRYEDNFDKTW